ncbi:uncharacterized protein LOC133293271 [Gastrolobium bilobum]|uniref:uncharacterized protein LOC133293271 n=1 Tax=Gastrolobium bilobum TaxID=150636 RepID=UPI002AB0ECE5|nr:uncharacterized protein LOC133293271 [Gastrolobium bilobum]
MEAQLATLMNEVKNLKIDQEQPRMEVLQLTATESEPCSACGENHDSTDCPSTALVCYTEDFGNINFTQARDNQHAGSNNNQNPRGTIVKDHNHNPQWKPPMNQRPYNNQQQQHQQGSSMGNRAYDQQRRPNYALFPRDDQHINTLENHIAASLNTKTSGKLPGDTDVLSRSSPEQIKAVTLRSGRIATQTSTTPKTTNPGKERNEPLEVSPSMTQQQPTQVAGEEDQELGERIVADKQTQVGRSQPIRPPQNKQVPVTILFPQRTKKQQDDKQFGKFLDILKQFQINIPLVDSLEQMPKYAKFMKDVLSKKRGIKKYETVKMTQESCKYLGK